MRRPDHVRRPALRRAVLAVLMIAGGGLAMAGQPGSGRSDAALAQSSVNPCSTGSSNQTAAGCKPGMDAALHPFGVAAGKHGQEYNYQLTRDGNVPAPGTTSTPPLVQAAAEKSSLPVSGGSWSSLGPSPIGSGGSTTEAGRVLAFAYQQTTGTLFGASADGGIWKTSNNGTSWTPLTDSMPSLAVDSLAIDPNNSQTIFAGTGEYSYCIDCLYGVGIYKSTDGGTTWTAYGSNVFNQDAVTSIVVDPTNSNRVFAGLLYSTGGNSNLGVAVSTDGGQTWTDPTGTALTGKNVTSLTIDNAGDVYAAAGNNQSAPAAVYVSTDHGGSWTSVSSGLPGANANQVKISLDPNTAGMPMSSQRLFAIVGDDTQATYGKILGVYRSTNGGGGWTRIATSANTGASENQAWYDIYVAVDPRDATGNTVWFGLSDVYKTTNALAATPTWTDLTCSLRDCTPVQPVHPDQHAIAFVGGNTFFGNDGGVNVSTDNGASFGSANGNLTITQFYGGALGTGATSSRVLAGAQDNGTDETNGAGWSEVVSGDGMQTAIDYSNNQNMYGEFEQGDIFATHDGSTFAAAKTGIDTNDKASWNAPLAMDPNTPGTLYSARTHVWKTTNSAGSWSNISSSISPDGPLTAIAVARTDPNTVYIGNVNGHLWATHDGGTTWPSLDGAGCDPAHPSPATCSNNGITGIAVDPTNSNVVYVTVNGFQGAQKYHVFKTFDGGTTWYDISTTLPDVPFQAVAVNPSSPNTVYAAANVGVYVSYDGGNTWDLLGSGLPNVAVYQLVPNANGSALVAFTHGRGAWRINTVTATISATPNPVPYGSTSTSVSWNTGDGSFGQVYVSVNGGADTLFAQGPSGSASAPWIQAGSTYVFKLFASNTHATQLTSVTVTESVPTITATPNPVPSGSSTTVINWNTGNGSTGQVYVSVNGGGDILVAQGPSGATSIPWITAGSSYVFKLYFNNTHTTLLATVTVSVAQATISASPNPVPDNSTTTNVSWNTGDGSTGQVYVSVNGGGDVQVTQGPSGTVQIPWISTGSTYVFKLYAGTAHTTVLSTVSVSHTPISATPNPVPLNSSTTNISWDTGNGSTGQVYVSVNGGGDILVAQGPYGNLSIPWIYTGSSYVFKLFAGTSHTTLLGSVTVTHVLISASPNPVPSGQTTTNVSWATPDGSIGQVWVSVNGGTDFLFAQGSGATSAAPWISPGSTYVFKLYADITHLTQLASVTVTGS